MKHRRGIFAALAAFAFLLSAIPASAQSTCSQYLYYGNVLTVAQWQFCFGSKQDSLNYVPVNKAGDTMLGKLNTFPSSISASGFNIAPGLDPSSPKDGDVWITLTGIYARINGTTVGPLIGITGSAPISVSAAGVVSLDAPYTALTASNGGIVYSGATNLAILSGTATARQMLQSGASTTPAWSTTTWPATSTINRILYSSAANVIGEIITANNGILNTSSGGVPSITPTPTLGVNGGTGGSITLNGATSGSGTIRVAAAAGTATFQLPTTNGSNTNVLITDGAGNTSWAAAGAGTVTSATVAAGAGISVSGTCTITSTGTCTVAANNSMGANKVQALLSGSGTVTTPTGAAWAKFTLIGGGGGGGGGGTASGGAGTAGGNTCINTSGAACTTPVYQAGGGGGGVWTSSTGGTGGTVSGSGSCLMSVAGGGGGPSLQNFGVPAYVPGSAGANSSMGGAGANSPPSSSGAAAAVNSGSGGQGGSSGNVANGFSGPGGGAGATCVAFIQSPAASYTYAIGASGGGGTAGTNGGAGGAGGSGQILAEYGFN